MGHKESKIKKKAKISKKKNLVIYFFGDTKVGKTEIIGKYIKNYESEKKPSKCLNVFNKTIKKETENSIIDINLELCEFTGEEIFNNFIKIFPKYQGIFVLVYDVTNKKSFNNLIKWAEIALNCRGNNNIAIIGNKNDLTEEKVVSIEEG